MQKKSKRSYKRIISIAIVLVLFASVLVSCNKKKEETGAVYDVKNYQFSDYSNMYNYRFMHVADKIVLYGSFFDDSASSYTSRVFFFDENGQVYLNYDINFHEDEFIDASLDENGNMYFARYANENPANAVSVAESTVTLIMGAEDEAIEENTDEAILTEAENTDEMSVENEDEMPAENTDEMSAEQYNETVDDQSDEEIAEAEANEEPVMEKAEVNEETVMEETEAIEEPVMEETEVVEEPVEDETYYGEDTSSDTSSEPSKEEEEIEYESRAELIKVDSNGNLSAVKKLYEDSEIADILKQSEYINQIIYTDGFVYVVIDGNIIKYDLDFNYVSHIAEKKVSKDIKEGNFVRSRDGELYCWYLDASRAVNLGEVDLSEGKIKDSMKVMDETWYVNVVAGTSMDFLVRKGSVLYGFNYKDTQYTKLVDFLDSDIMTDNVSSVAGLSDDKFLAIYRNMEDDSMNIGFFKKTNEKKNTDKIDITLAMVENDSDIKKAVANFNKKNTKYRIHILDYNAMYGTDEYMVSDSVIEKINTDIIAGNMPDILLVTKNLPINTYINKELLEDLYPYIENDPEMSISDYDEHILDVFSKDGKLFRLVPSYYIKTVFIKESFVPNKTSWTVKEAQEIFKNSGALLFFNYMERDYALECCMNMSGSQFIDIENGECRFDTEEFRDMLAFIKSFPSEYDFNDQLSAKIWDSMDVMYRENLVLCENTTIAGFNPYLVSIKGEFGEKVTNIGFPTQNGQGSSIDPTLTLAMSSLSEHKDACWEFMREFLLDDYQNSISWGFPVKNSSMDSLYDKAKHELYYSYVWDGKEYREPVVAYISGVEVPVDPMTDEEEEYFRNFVKSIDNTTGIDAKIMSILKEECADYFEGRATAEEVSNRLQSRIKIYIYESQ